MDALLTVAEYEVAARDRLPAGIWDYISGGSGQERTLAANREAFGRLALRPRVLVDVSRPDLSTTLLGAPLRVPIGVAPVAYHQLAHPDGEVATARAAPFLVVSVFASRTLEEIAAAADGPLWLQLYWFRRREVVTRLVRRAEAAGYRALVLTLDTPRVGRRLRDVRRGFAIPAGIVAANVETAVMARTHVAVDGESALARHSREQFDPSLGPADLAWLCGQTELPVLVKGVLTAEDAELALAHGAAGVVVSNHGGRQLDGAVASVDALAEVAAAVGGRGRSCWTAASVPARTCCARWRSARARCWLAGPRCGAWRWTGSRGRARCSTSSRPSWRRRWCSPAAPDSPMWTCVYWPLSTSRGSSCSGSRCAPRCCCPCTGSTGCSCCSPSGSGT
ncbi:hypothetical protein Phou_006940 [Phytohabitans houttuyneae]|uniref:FMN hydroxy acid dehydrogenase domain-containing protein n=1 Tax=Phytohabitans houttuyneae TaxID=1076126 RepID=A0A6V8JZ03_9ACTN|nr:hypothetical protein Phou_006940 [Phytohabitans houttuyneae]